MAVHEDLQSVAAHADDARHPPLAGAAGGVGIARPEGHDAAPFGAAGAYGLTARRGHSVVRDRQAADGPPQQRSSLVRSVHQERIAGAVRPTSDRQTPISLFAEKRVALIGLACRPPREVAAPITHWSHAELRDAFAHHTDGASVSAATIGRELVRADLKPHRIRYFLTSRDPNYDEKLRDIVGLYLRPPAGAAILSLDEKPTIQALERIHRELPMRPGDIAAREFEYRRHGVMHLFGAFNVRTGTMLGDVRDGKTHVEFIDLLEMCAWRYRQGEVHCVLDNASYHSTPEVKAWLADHPRFVFHYTPTHASWLNQIECWFSILNAKVLKRGDFASRDTLRWAILQYIAYWNSQAHPFNWAYGEELIHDKERIAA